VAGAVVGTVVTTVGGVVGGTVVGNVVAGPEGVVVHPAARSSPKSAQQTRIIPILIFMRYYERRDYKRFLETETSTKTWVTNRIITPRGRFELPRRRAPMVFETIAFPD
jgi:hypothetical protein